MMRPTTNVIWLNLLLLLLITSCSKQDSTTHSPGNAVLQNEAPEGALPLLAQPTYYQLDLSIDPSRDHFSGQVKIDITLNQETDGIWLHGKDLRIKSTQLTTSAATARPVDYQQELDSGVARIDFGQTIPAGEISLSFDYEADFDRNLSGLFKVEEQGDAYVLAKSESIQARKYLPSFDQPRFKAPFLISMTIPNDLHAISNAPEVSRTPVGERLTKIQFAETRSMPTYLLSLAVGPFDIQDDGIIPKNDIRDFDIPVRRVARRGRANDMNFVMGITPRYLEIFEQQLGQPYPFKKLDIVAAPQWPSGATELSAAITYREQKVLLGDTPAPGAKLSIMNTHAHEIAHMWFGNLVTPPWWDDLWLKEGFSTWATTVALVEFEPDNGHELDALLENFLTMNADALASTRAIRQPIIKNDNIRNAYDAITYSKSQAVIHMVDSYFGSDSFRKAMGKYVAQFADSIADSPQFYQSIAKHTGEKALAETFRQFIEQKGVPLMDVAIECDTSEAAQLTLTQSRYRPLGSPISDTPEWTVPTCVRYFDGASSQKACGMISPDNNTLTLNTHSCPIWLIPNADGSGYYRWQLGEMELVGLFNHFDSLNDGEKIALIDSIISGFDAGTVELTTLLNMIELSSQSEIRQIVEMPLENLRRYIRHVFSTKTAQAVISTITPWYLSKLALLDAKGKKTTLSDSDQLLKNRLLEFTGTVLQHRETRAELAEQAKQFIAQHEAKQAATLSSDLYLAAFTVAVEDIGQPFFDQLIIAREKIDDPLFDNASASALGALKDISLATTVQDYALSNNIGARESFNMIVAMLEDRSSRDIHWPWLTTNLSQVLKKIPSQWRRRSPRFAQAFCEKKWLKELDTLYARHAKQAPGSELALAQTKESILLCASLKEHVETSNK